MIEVQDEARAIVDKALSDVAALGFSEDQASALFVVQGSIRIQDERVLREVQRFVDRLAVPDIPGRRTSPSK